MFALVVELLTGRYVATAFNDRNRSEWPPHPSRLLSALAAAHFDDPRPDERGALEWLEKQGPPSLAASEASERELHTVFVPVNDRAEGEVTVAGRKTTFLDHPERRIRQARTFPSMTPADPRVAFVWPDAIAPDEVAAAMDRLSGRVVRLGHSSSLVSVRTTQSGVEPNWRPDDAGQLRLRLFSPGQLRALEERFAVHRETEPRVMPPIFQLYSQRPVHRDVPTPSSVFSDGWLVLGRVGGIALPSNGAVGVARMVRKVILSFAEEPIPEVISGHRADGMPSERPHLAVVPLPFVGHFRADGSLLGVALVLPHDTTQADRRALFRAVARWEASHRREGEETPSLPVHFGPAGTMLLARVDDAPRQRNLEPSVWCGPARRWTSATPIALDRNPGDLRAREPHRLAQAMTEAEDAVRVACQRVGLPRPSQVVILSSPALAGSAKARHYPAYPGTDGRVQRVLSHALVEFTERVAGPILLGAGRYVGLGLMRPADHD
jgi:CRISPR-associated protein Csb2